MTDVTKGRLLLLVRISDIFVQLLHACYNSLSLSRYNVFRRTPGRNGTRSQLLTSRRFCFEWHGFPRVTLGEVASNFNLRCAPSLRCFHLLRKESILPTFSNVSQKIRHCISRFPHFAYRAPLIWPVSPSVLSF